MCKMAIKNITLLVKEEFVKDVKSAINNVSYAEKIKLDWKRVNDSHCVMTVRWRKSQFDEFFQIIQTKNDLTMVCYPHTGHLYEVVKR